MKRRRRRLFPKISYTNFRAAYPCAVGSFKEWFSVKRFWSGEIINLCVKHHQISLDFRRDWIGDMKQS